MNEINVINDRQQMLRRSFNHFVGNLIESKDTQYFLNEKICLY